MLDSQDHLNLHLKLPYDIVDSYLSNWLQVNPLERELSSEILYFCISRLQSIRSLILNRISQLSNHYAVHLKPVQNNMESKL